MTVLGSVEALNGLAEGEQIVVRSRQLGNRRWTKTGDTFSREGGTVDATFFTGYIIEGRVTRVDDAPARPGDWFANERGRYAYFHYATTDAGLLVSLTFHEGIFRSDNEYRLDQFDTEATRMVRLERMPDAVAQNPESVRLIQERLMDRLASVTGQLAAANERATEKPAPPPVQAEKEQPDEDAPTPTERVLVTVRVFGHSDIPDLVKRAALGLPREAVFDEEQEATPWSYETRYLTTVARGVDACDTVDRARIEATLPQYTRDWDIEVSCSNDPTPEDTVNSESNVPATEAF